MDTLLNADIFFFITSAVTVLVGIGLVVILYYIIRIVKTIDHVITGIRTESDALLSDVRSAHAKIKSEGVKLRHIISLVLAVVKMSVVKKKKSKK